jgi:CMP-N,N'-diacetyllegionaminic acid synthase
MILALLTGRGGSKLKDKNILKINGKPCLAYPCIEAKKVKMISDFYVSSDDKKILNIANSFGFKKIKRPKKYAKANSQHIDTINHSLNFFSKNKIFPKIIIVLLSNAPIIKAQWIVDSINILKRNKNIDSVVPVVEDNDHHPLRAKKMNNNILKPQVKIKKKISTNRQDLDKNYFLCHNFWAIRTSAIIKNNGDYPWMFMGKKSYGYKIRYSADIHNKIDIKIAEYILKQ